MKRFELQTVLFRLADAATTIQTKLDKAEATIATLKQQKAGGTATSAVNTPNKTAPKPIPKQSGMSVINPGTRKRKAARGVEFD